MDGVPLPFLKKRTQSPADLAWFRFSQEAQVVGFANGLLLPKCGANSSFFPGILAPGLMSISFVRASTADSAKGCRAGRGGKSRSRTRIQKPESVGHYRQQGDHFDQSDVENESPFVYYTRAKSSEE